VTARPILRVGLTGGIASGKTTVAGFLAELGALVLDADRIAHDMIRRGGEAHAEVVARFGEGVLGPDGDVDRRVLGALVFRDPAALRDLNAIVHPRILPEVERRIGHYLSFGHATLAVLEAALLVETGMYRQMDRLVVVRCGKDAQIQRLVSRQGLTPEEALLRIESQAPLEAKLNVADYVIDTDTTVRETREQTGRVHAALVADFESRFGGPGSRS
jgi:dephospho-CoA kinase